MMFGAPKAFFAAAAGGRSPALDGAGRSGELGGEGTLSVLLE